MRFTAAMVCLLTAISPSMVKGLSDGPACNCDACCDTTWSMQQDYPTGYYVAHTGSLKVLVVFARLKEDTLARGGNCWQYWNDSLPDFASDLVTPDTDPENFTEPSLNDYYWRMSSGTYFVYGDYYPEVMVTLLDRWQYSGKDELNHRNFLFLN